MSEYLLLRTTATRYPTLDNHLLASHPWANPEVVALPITAGSASHPSRLGGTVSQ